MTEAEWLACADPKAMERFLDGKASERKMRLFGVAVCRRIWELLDDERSRKAVEVAERYADGDSTAEELDSAYHAAWTVADPRYQSIKAAAHTELRCAWAAWAALLASHPQDTAVGASEAAEAVGAEDERAAQCELLRCVLGNPFHPITLDPAWQTPIVVALATAAYDERILPAGHLHRDRLAVLADALEDAGCDNADLLSHLRSPGPHVRGCFVVDLLLGKE